MKAMQYFFWTLCFLGLTHSLLGEEIIPQSVVSSITTDPRYPGMNTQDGQLDSKWKILTNENSGWLEYRWEKPALVSGVNWSGSLAGDTVARLWFQQNGEWKPFLAGTLDHTASIGWLDLSLDQVTTTAIQWRVQGVNASQSSLEELHIHGRPAHEVYCKIMPKSLSASENTSWFLDEENLIDGDTQTGWAIGDDDYGFKKWWDYKGKERRYTQTWGEGSVTFEFGELINIGKIKLFLPRALSSELTVVGDTGTEWVNLGRLNSGTFQGWQFIEVPEGTFVTRVKIKAPLDDAAIKITEVEVWGKGGSYGRYPQNMVPESQEIGKDLNFSFSSANQKGELLMVANGAVVPETLIIGLNGRDLEVKKFASLRGKGLYRLILQPWELSDDGNFLKIYKANDLRLEDLQWSEIGDYGQVGTGQGSLGDGIFYTSHSGESSSSFVNLGSSVRLERVEVYAKGAHDVSAWAHRSGDDWVTLSSMSNSDGRWTFDGNVITGQVRVQVLGECGEIQVYGSPITPEGPRLKVLWPKDGEKLTQGEILQGKLVGWVSDIDAVVTINNMRAQKKGSIFWIDLRDLQLVDGEINFITLICQDEEGRQRQQQLALSVDLDKMISIDQDDGLVYTGSSSYEISGRVHRRSTDLLINGKPIPVSGGRFSTTIPLTEGFNLINIQVLKRGRVIGNFVRKVVRTSQELTLIVDSPLDNGVISAPQVTITGRAQGVGQVRVSVNGKETAAKDGKFILTGVPLVEGINKLEVAARDNSNKSLRFVLTVTRDTQAPLVTFQTPLPGAIVSNSIVPVILKIDDANSSWVSVNQGVWVPTVGGMVKEEIPLGEGLKIITAIVVDQMGNTSRVSIPITVDLSAPLGFEVRNLSGEWTNNPQPVIEFNPIDLVSGIQFTEVIVDGNQPVTVQSPATLGPLTDGSHFVVVRAWDKAGWTTISTININIDTVPPLVQKNVITIPGKSGINVRWDTNDEPGQSWRLERNPAWPEGTRTINQASYEDGDLTLQNFYAYRVWAVDRAGNEGPKSEWIQSQVGLESAPVSNGGAIARYKNITVTLPTGSLDPEISKVTINEIDTNLLVYPPDSLVGSVYQLRVIRLKDGVETPSVHGDLKDFATVTVEYDTKNIPEGFSEGHLKVYYFESLWGRWLPVETSLINPSNHTISFITNHFTDFSVQATSAKDQTPQEMRDVKYNPFNTAVTHGPLNVSAQTGSVSTVFTEFDLPGKNGLDLVIRRTYDSSLQTADDSVPVPKERDTSAPQLSEDGDDPWHVGSGWRLAMPSMKWNAAGLWITGSEGEVLSLDQMKLAPNEVVNDKATITLITHESGDLKAEIIMKRVYNYFVGQWPIYNEEESRAESVTLYEKSGRVVKFDKQGRVTSISDPVGLNSIAFSYTVGGKTEITDTMGRKISITYSDKVIKSIQVSKENETGNMVQYTYIDNNKGWKNRLQSAQDIGGRVWNYTYENEALKSQVQAYYQTSETETEIGHLKTVSGPGIGQTTVIYAKYAQVYDDENYGETKRVLDEKVQVVKVDTSLGDNILRSKTYSYDWIDGYEIKKDRHLFFNRAHTIDDGRVQTILTFQKFYKDRFSLSAATESLSRLLGVYYGERWNLREIRSRLIKSEIQSAGVVLEKTEQTWFDETMRISTQKTIKGENNYREVTNTYDSWGNPKLVIDRSLVNGQETKRQVRSSFYGMEADLNMGDQSIGLAEITLTRHRKDLMAARIVEYSGPTGTSGVEKERHTYTGLGQESTSQRWDGTRWISSAFEYDTAGELSKVTGPAGQVTRITRDYGTNPLEYTITKVQAQVDLGNGKEDLVSKEGIRSLTGTLSWTVDPRDAKTTKVYDGLNRITKVIEPDNLITTVVYDDSKLISKVQSPMGGVQTYYFDNLGRLNKVEKTTDVNQSPDELPELITTVLEYNQYDEVLAVKGPISNKEKDETRTLDTLVTRFTYDPKGRITSVRSPGSQASKTTTYNDLLNQVINQNELGFTMTQTMDWAGKVLEQSQMVGGKLVKISTVYDGMGRPISQTDALKNVTSQSYNSLGQEVSSKGAIRDVWENEIIAKITPETTKGYDDAGNVIRITQSLGNGESREVRQEFNGLGFLLKTATKVGEKTIITKYVYDRNGNKISQSTGYEGEKLEAQSWTYDQFNRVKTQTDEENHTTTFEYDEQGNRKGIIDPRESLYPGRFKLTMTYDSLNRLVKAILPNQNPEEKPTIQFGYDGRGNLLTKREADGLETRYTYDLNNNVKTQTITDGKENYTTSYGYDDAGRETSVKSPSGLIIYSQYDEAGRLILQGNEQRGWNTTTYDEKGNKTSTTDGKGNRTNYTYNPDGQILTVTDPKGQTNSMDYDRLNQLVRTIDGERNQRLMTYDNLGRMTSETTPWDGVNTFEYDPWSQVVKQMNANGTVFVRKYTPAKHLENETATNGNRIQTRNYTYDEAGDIKTINSDGIITQFNTTPSGYRPDPYSLVRTKKVQDLETQYSYDTMQRLTGVTLPNAQTMTYGYNTIGQLDNIPEWIQGNLKYDNSGRLTGYTLRNGITKTFKYDNQDRIQNLEMTLGNQTINTYGYTYDKASNIVTKNQNVYTYDELNQLIGANEKGHFQKEPNEIEPTYGIEDRDYQGTQILNFKVEPETLISLDTKAKSLGVDLGTTFEINRIDLKPNNPNHRVRPKDLTVYTSTTNTKDYNKTENWTLTTQPDGTLTLKFPRLITARYLKVTTIWDDRDLDNRSLETNATFTNKAKELIKVWILTTTRIEGYQYDKAGNRITLTVDDKTKNITYHHNKQGGNLNWVKNDGEWEYTYDKMGNTTGKTKPGETWTYEWDLYNRLIAVNKNGIQITTYVYDAENYRIQRKGKDGTTNYAYGRNGALTYQKNETTGLTRTYTYLDNQLIGWTDTKAGVSTKYFSVIDHLGSVTAVTDSTAKILWQSEYTPYGNIAGIEGSYEFSGLYTGKDIDPDTGLSYHWNRWRSEDGSRFISEDPIRAGGNFYTYGNNSPLVYFDPTGLDGQNYRKSESYAEELYNDAGYEWDPGTDTFDYLPGYDSSNTPELYSGAQFRGDRSAPSDGGSWHLSTQRNDPLKTDVWLKGTLSKDWEPFVEGNQYPYKIAGGVLVAVGLGSSVVIAPEVIPFVTGAFLKNADKLGPMLGEFSVCVGPTAARLGVLRTAAGSGLKTAEDILRPAGKLIGDAGTSSKIRILQGSADDAAKLFDELATGGKPITGTTYPGRMFELPGGGVIKLRPSGTSGNFPTIDVDIPGIGIREIKFKP